MSDDEQIERDELECGVLFVGAGPANLAGAIRLMDLITAHNEGVEAGTIQGKPIDVEETPVMVIEKAAEVGEHVMSGAILDPRALRELIPDFEEREPPFEGPALRDRLVFMFKGGGSVKAPITPPTFNNHGNFICSLNRVTKWLAEIAEEKGVQILPGFPGAEVLFQEDGRTIRGVRTADKGVGKDGQRKDSFEPGTDLISPLTIFGEGSRGSLTKGLVRKFGLQEGRNPQIYSTGVKEVWKLPAGRLAAGEVIHTAGAPLRIGGDEFGGGFVSASTTTTCRSGSWPPSTPPTRPSTRTACSPSGSSTRSFARSWRAARWCATARRRSPRAAGSPSRARTSPAACSSATRPGT